MADTPSTPGDAPKPKLVARSMRTDPGRTEPKAPAETPSPAKPAAASPAPQAPADAGPASTDRVPLSSTMFIAVNMPPGPRREAITNALEIPAATMKTFADRYRVIGANRTDKDEPDTPAEFRIFLDAAAAERTSAAGSEPDAIGHALLTELVQSTRVRLRDSEYVAVVLPLKDKDNPRTLSLDAFNQWRYWDAMEKSRASTGVAASTPAVGSLRGT
jgi:hypothetical protein